MSGSGGKTLNRCGAKLSIVFTPSRDGRDKACDARQAVDTLETSEASADPSQERSGQDRSEPGHAEQDACVLVSAKALGDLLVEGGECLVDPLDLGYEQCTDPLGSKDSALGMSSADGAFGHTLAVLSPRAFSQAKSRFAPTRRSASGVR